MLWFITPTCWDRQYLILWMEGRPTSISFPESSLWIHEWKSHGQQSDTQTMIYTSASLDQKLKLFPLQSIRLYITLFSLRSRTTWKLPEFKTIGIPSAGYRMAQRKRSRCTGLSDITTVSWENEHRRLHVVLCTGLQTTGLNPFLYHGSSLEGFPWLLKQAHKNTVAWKCQTAQRCRKSR